MMTVVIRGRRKRRGKKIDWPSPRTWCIGAERYYCRMWTPETETGSAKPGRGGRRKRERRAAGERALALSLQIWETTDPHVETWPLLLRSERLLPDPPLHGNPGRRERRRRAKLRRRRERRDRLWREEQRRLFESPYLPNLRTPWLTRGA
jgi:hypothetical protein